MNAAVQPGERPAFPAAYAAFLPVLDRLSDSLVELLHGQLLQFERLSSSFDWQELAPQGEFEGLGGLTTRGEIAHIVQSELLLHTEAPLEFLRRLAEAETLFLEKQYADPGTRPVYRAMVSVGPGLLGHGRLVALAALFFMARIAAARGAEFHWCFLPREQGAVWFDALSVNTIKRFLRAASYREIDGDDIEAAQRVWEGLVPDARGAGKRDYLDWTIGAAIAPSGRASGIDGPAGALRFVLEPPVPGERRRMQIGVRRHGTERTRATVVLPDDRICISALNDPFAPLKPSDVPRLATEPKPGLQGWEPLYFVTPRADRKIVRMPGGVLVLAGDAAWNTTGRWFIPLPEDVKLAGASLESDRLLHIAVHSPRSGRDTMMHWKVVLVEGRATIVALLRREVPSAQLFRNQRPWAVPAVNWGAGLEIYSASGHAFAFEARGSEGEAHFTPLYKAAKLFWSNGVYGIVRDKADPFVQAVRHSHRRHAGFAIDAEAWDANRLLDLAYAPAQRSLSYSVAPGVWTVVFQGQAAEPATLRLEPHETLLAAYGAAGQLTARIWSDARYGGAGTVRTMRYQNGVGVLKQAALKLGQDALSIARVQLCDDGIWAMKVDADQAPTELLLYRRKQKHASSQCKRFDLHALASEAVRIELNGLHD